VPDKKAFRIIQLESIEESLSAFFVNALEASPYVIMPSFNILFNIIAFCYL